MDDRFGRNFHCIFSYNPEDMKKYMKWQCYSNKALVFATIASLVALFMSIN